MSTEEPNPAQLQSTAFKPLKVFSCVLCAQRKVKCDRKQPCSNCIKSGANCTPGAPPKPRSRRRRVIETDVAARLQRYEELLHRHGIKLDELDDPGISGTPDVASTKIEGVSPSYGPGIAGKDGIPLYAHNNLWSTLSDEILDASSDDERDLTIRVAHQSLDSEPSTPPKIELELFDLDTPLPDLSSLHPQPLQIFRLWQTFLDNVHPLTKIIHAPSIQQEISRASGSPQNFSKPMQALMFSIYSCSVASMRDEDCMEILGEDRTLAHRRFAGIAKKALTVAGLLTTKDTMVLQAFVLFLLSIRNIYDSQALWILTGVAVRLTERLGLNREPFLESLSVFNAEYGRRIVWQIAILDGHTAGRARVDTSRMLYRGDTKFPLNVNDADLDINMRERPQEHSGVTEMVFCLIRCEFGSQLHNQAAIEGNNMLRSLGNPSTPVAEKETFISKLESIFEERFVKHCNPAIPLQLLSMVMVKVMFGRLRLAARHPRRFQDRGATMSQEEKDSLFAICLMMIEYDNQGHRLSGMHRFMWHVKANFQLDAFVYILNELRHSSVGDRADHAWREVLECFDHHSDVLTDTKNPLHVAIGNLALKSWGARESMLAHLGQTLPDGEIPRQISILRSQRSVVVSPKSHSSVSDQRVAGEPAQNQAFQAADPTTFDSMDSTPIDWEYWNELINASGVIIDDTQYQQPVYDARAMNYWK
ncbi:hypothetical protein V500_09813 [Pseudogymnoascus sp. VKM F-4518 (FW-2643)]|nr:hypothetical protein V500_09813 [Pseudogymnoascus sp. VKM F-4518 (FW-2643)]